MFMDSKGGFLEFGEVLGHEGEHLLVPKGDVDGSWELDSSQVVEDRGRETPVGLLGVQIIDPFEPSDVANLQYQGGIQPGFGLTAADPVNPVNPLDR